MKKNKKRGKKMHRMIKIMKKLGPRILLTKIAAKKQTSMFSKIYRRNCLKLLSQKRSKTLLI